MPQYALPPFDRSLEFVVRRMPGVTPGTPVDKTKIATRRLRLLYEQRMIVVNGPMPVEPRGWPEQQRIAAKAAQVHGEGRFAPLDERLREAPNSDSVVGTAMPPRRVTVAQEGPKASSGPVVPPKAGRRAGRGPAAAVKDKKKGAKGRRRGPK